MSSTVANERGIALVITLLVVALLTITVVEFTYSVEVDYHMTRNALDGVQAGLLARSGINFGEAVLLKNFETQPQPGGVQQGVRFAFLDPWCVDNDGQPNFSGDYPSCDFEPDSKLRVPDNMRLMVRIFDEGGKIDLNQVRPQRTADCPIWENAGSGTGNSTNPANPVGPLARLDALGRVLDLAGAGPEVKALYESYWVNVCAGLPSKVAGQTTPTGRQPTPGSISTALQDWQHLVRNEFASLDDAARLLNLPPEVVRRLRPLVTAIPTGSGFIYPPNATITQQRANLGTINVNTAPKSVLTAILSDVQGGDECVQQILTARTDAPLTQSPCRLSPFQLGVNSTRFRIYATAVVNPNPITGKGGIRRAASMLIGVTRCIPLRPNCWMVIQEDWQKEGGVGLFQQQSDAESGIDNPLSMMPERR